MCVSETRLSVSGQKSEDRDFGSPDEIDKDPGTYVFGPNDQRQSVYPSV